MEFPIDTLYPYPIVKKESGLKVFTFFSFQRTFSDQNSTLGPVVEGADNTIQLINHYPADQDKF